MIYNGYAFWVFFIFVISLYVILPHRQQNRMLLAASYFFYGYWDWRFIALILFYTIVNYYTAKSIFSSTSHKERKRYLIIALVSSLGMLSIFKYYGFFASEFQRFVNILNVDISLPILSLILPVGISFYTFQTLSYTIDVYRNETKPDGNFFDFALYVSFFPQLVAGPIERSSRLLPQILNGRVINLENFFKGAYMVVMGLFQKVIIADNMAPIVNYVFAQNPSELSGSEVLTGIYAFAFQIYGDFSGYSLIAKGVAKWMGFDLMWNFKMPYFAISPSDFWRRWHISLSTWLRDYLYIPLGGNKRGTLLTLRNLIITMTLGGLWHGAAWTFIIWGIYHGFLLIMYRLFDHYNPDHDKQQISLTHRIFRVVVMFNLVCISWLIFRADSISQVYLMLGRIITDFRITPFALYGAGMMVFYVLPFILIEFVIERNNDMLYLLKANWLKCSTFYTYCILMLWVFPPLIPQIFIYFQF